MRWMYEKKKLCVVFAIVFAMLLTGIIAEKKGMFVEAKMASVQKRMAKEVFRFHVLANSDSEVDQELKMKVKGEIIAYMKEDLPQSDGVEMTKAWARKHTDEIEAIAAEVIAESGYEYPVRAEVTTCYFPEKTYGDVIFPKGDYEALRIEIGKGKGRNWWCVLYPNLCFIDSVNAVVPEEGKEELKEVLDEEEYEMVTAGTKFKIKWFFLQ